MKLPDILIEDEVLVALDKPSGMPVSREAGPGGRASLLSLAREAFGGALSGVHRLDTDASGVVLLSRTKPALDALSGQFQSKTVQKVQHALVVALGEAPAASFSVDLAIGPDEARQGLSRAYKKRGGKPALTEFRVLESFGRFLWIECRPITGRNHQVRVHLASAGLPVLNDALYGDASVRLLLSDIKRGYKGLETERPLVSRLALHATSLGFLHPVSREPVEVVSPLPKDLDIALRNLRKFYRPERMSPRGRRPA
jgi:RluA family pseudouridine synthase